MSLTEQQKAQLLKDLDRTAVKTRKGPGGTQLSYVDTFYVKDTLCRVFDPGGWGKDVPQLDKVIGPEQQERKKRDGGTYTVWFVAYAAKVRLNVEGGMSTEDWGYGQGEDGRNAGTAIESAIKEAVTDALKRCAVDYGRRMGLALYDKEQAHVADPPRYANPGPHQGRPLADVPDDVLAEYRERVAKASEDPKKKGKALHHLAEIDAEIATRPSMTGQEAAE